MTAVIIGATSMEQLKANIGAADVTLAPDVMNGLRTLHRRFPAPM